jgi:hypothetical protein
MSFIGTYSDEARDASISFDDEASDRSNPASKVNADASIDLETHI